MVEYLIFLLNYLMNYYTPSIISYYIPIESKTVLNFMKLSHRCTDAILERKQNCSMDSKFIFESPLTFKLFYPKIETLVLSKHVRRYINELIYIYFDDDTNKLKQIFSSAKCVFLNFEISDRLKRCLSYFGLKYTILTTKFDVITIENLAQINDFDAYKSNLCIDNNSTYKLNINGEIHEFKMFNYSRRLSTDEIESLREYLSKKYIVKDTTWKLDYTYIAAQIEENLDNLTPNEIIHMYETNDYSKLYSNIEKSYTETVRRVNLLNGKTLEEQRDFILKLYDEFINK